MCTGETFKESIMTFKCWIFNQLCLFNIVPGRWQSLHSTIPSIGFITIATWRYNIWRCRYASCDLSRAFGSFSRCNSQFGIQYHRVAMARILACSRQQQHGRLRRWKVSEQSEAFQLVSMRAHSELYETSRLPVLPKHRRCAHSRCSSSDTVNTHAVNKKFR